MFGLMGKQWRFNKSVRELVIISEYHGASSPEMREQTIKSFLEISRDLKIASTKLDGHEQAMIMIMMFVGSGGPIAFKDAVSRCGEYARQHGIMSAVESYKTAAADLLKIAD